MSVVLLSKMGWLTFCAVQSVQECGPRVFQDCLSDFHHSRQNS
ncbi:conserved hypothetical protein [delta proteobacterium NaphS2]|nr:conserved hypothetical protein [delta proteobacterium NaphS2]